MVRRRGGRAVAALAAMMVLVAGCADSPARANQIVVFAASSLAKSFGEVGHAVTVADPEVAVEFSFAGSAVLLSQLAQGADADVFASADAATMDKAVRAGLVKDRPVAFATNTLAIAVAPGNPKRIDSFRDLRQVSVVVCAPQVPCGAPVPRLESRLGVELSPISEESSVADVLNKVVTGQADAGLVYATDIRGAGGKVAEVPFPEAASEVNVYQIAVLRSSANLSAATRFVQQVVGPTGRAVLLAAGFGTP